MNPFIVHIGLPKTGTTTLQQDVFPNLDCRYLGVVQPRERKQSDLYSKIMRYIEFGGGRDDLGEIRTQIKRMLLVEPVLLSDEMFVVSQPTTFWQEKLARLSQIMTGFESHLVVALRDPLDGIRSFFQELCLQDVSYRKMGFSNFVLSSPLASVYHYKLLLSTLEREFNCTDVHFLCFENTLMLGNVEPVISALGLKVSNTISINNRNAKSALVKTGSGFIVRDPSKFEKWIVKTFSVRNDTIRAYLQTFLWCLRSSSYVEMSVDEDRQVAVDSVINNSLDVYRNILEVP
jgi:hypothetical protein